MAININLASKADKNIARTNRIIAILRNISILLMVLFVLFVAGEYGFYFYQSNQKINNQKRINTLVAQLESESDVESNYRQAQSIITNSRRIVTSRKNFQDILSGLYTYLPSDVIITGLNFNQTTVVLDAQAPDVQPFVSAINNFAAIKDNSSELFGDIALTSVSRLRNGTYTFRLEIGLKKTI